MLILITRKWDVEVSPNKHMAKKEWHASISPSYFDANNPHGVGKLPLFHDIKGVWLGVFVLFIVMYYI